MAIEVAQVILEHVQDASGLEERFSFAKTSSASQVVDLPARSGHNRGS